MYKIGIQKTKLNEIEHDVGQLLNKIEYTPSKDKVLLKPNIVVAEPPENGSITHPNIVEAIAQYFNKKGIKVIIAEGTGIFSDAQAFEYLLQTTQYARLRDQLGIPIINLEQVERKKIPWRYGQLAIPKLFEDYEYINVPTMKTHSQTMVTLGVKNQKGIIPVKSKKIFHKKGLHSYIAALEEVLRPSLTIVDGLFCIEGNGPTGPPGGGEIKMMNLLVAGTHMMAVDNVCTDIMGIDAEEVKHLRSINKTDIKIIGEEPEEVRSGFKKPGKGPILIDPFVIHPDDTICTMCILSYNKAFSKIFNTPELYRELKEKYQEIHIIMGQSQPPPDFNGYAFCLGDCAKKTAQKRGFSHIRGCHPNYKDIVKHLFPAYYPGET